MITYFLHFSQDAIQCLHCGVSGVSGVKVERTVSGHWRLYKEMS